MVLAVSKPQLEATIRTPSRLVDFMGSYPPGDMALGELRGRCGRKPIPGSTAWPLGVPDASLHSRGKAHRNLMLTKALDLSARLKRR